METTLETVIPELVGNSPVVAAIIVIVILFLRALKDRDKTITDVCKDFADATREQTEESKKLREVLGAHSEVIRRCSERATP